MQLYYPRSFLKLILAGFSLAVLPLIFALINNAFSINQLATHSQRAVYQAVQATQNSRFLIEQINNMERSVRQFAIIGEPSLLQGYGLAHERFVDTARRMATLPLDARQKQALEALRAREAVLFDRIGQSGAKADVIRTAVAELAALSEVARALDEQGNLLVDREVDTMQKMAGEVQRFIFLQLLALVPIALLLVISIVAPITKSNAIGTSASNCQKMNRWTSPAIFCMVSTSRSTRELPCSSSPRAAAESPASSAAARLTASGFPPDRLMRSYRADSRFCNASI